jgi:hypothetical protein
MAALLHRCLVAAAMAAAALTSACASLTSGQQQAMSFQTDPAEADCTLTQSNTEIARFRTPGSVVLKRAKAPITIACTKTGYHPTRAMIDTTIAGAAWGNLVAGGIVGVVIDQSTGAAFRYYDPPKFTMVAAAESPSQTSQVIAPGITLLPPEGPLATASASLAAVAQPTQPAVATTTSAAVPTSATQMPQLGSRHRGQITVAGRSFPLLDGEWTVVATGLAYSNKRGIPMDRVYLAQMDGDRLARWIYISTNAGRNPAWWDRNKSVCDRTDAQAGYSDSMNNPKESECWVLRRRVSRTTNSSPSPADSDFDRWADSHGRPASALALSYYVARQGDFFYVDYFFNPDVTAARETATAGTGEALFARLKPVL